MSRNVLAASFVVLLASCFLSCSPTFNQPELTIESAKLLELPGENTKLQVTVDVRNTDSRNGNITSVEYVATVEGISSQQMTYSTPFELPGGATVTLDMPLTFTTQDALELLLKMQNDASLAYTVTGTFNAETAIGALALALDANGSAVVTVDIDDYFKQPSVSVVKIAYTGAAPSLGMDMDFQIKADVTNNAAYAATVKSVTYTVTMEGGITSSEATYSTPITVAASGDSGDQVTISDLPASFPVTASNALGLTALYGKIGQKITYAVKGFVTVSSDIGSGAMEFVLPLSVSGEADLAASM